MADYNGIASILNTTAGMTAIVNNAAHDDDVVSMTGVAWFRFNSVAASTIYASGNHWIGLGASSEQVKVCRRDGKMWYLYREEGTIFNYYKFLKIRWEGYTVYSSTSEADRLIYELFLIDDGRMFLNVVQTPTNSGNLGTSTLVCGSNTYNLTIGVNSTTPIRYTFTPTDANGTAWATDSSLIVIIAPFDRKYLIQSAGVLYTVSGGVLAAIEATDPTPDVFRASGTDDMPTGSLLVSLTDPAILYWQDSTNTLPVLTATVTGVPPVQSVITNDVDMTDQTIKGIESVVIAASADVLFAFSFDGLTWKGFVAGTWVTIDTENAGMTATECQNISLSDWAAVATTGHYRVRFTLTSADSYVNNISVNYLN